MMEIREICCYECGAQDCKLGYAHGGYGILLCVPCLLNEMDRQQQEVDNEKESQT